MTDTRHDPFLPDWAQEVNDIEVFPAWECQECGQISLEKVEECDNCGYKSFYEIEVDEDGCPINIFDDGYDYEDDDDDDDYLNENEF